MKVIVTRPRIDGEALAAKLAKFGHEAVMAPLLAIVPRRPVAIPARAYQFAVATSANALRVLTDAEPPRSLRILTVGPQSLAAARAAGFGAAEAHGGDVDRLHRHIASHFEPQAGPILYLSGAETAGDLEAKLRASGFSCDRIILYDAVTASGLGPARAVLAGGASVAVLLFSPRTARIWRNLVELEGLAADAAKAWHCCLSANVARVLPVEWKSAVTKSPDEAGMLTLLEQLPATQ
ncbi:MAG: uroporphyrinogen-III synthase [Alphaproteobacteria bacterium]|nr:uroporphyrinogen-III synthase [Alphaproteobacteria bacterium]